MVNENTLSFTDEASSEEPVVSFDRGAAVILSVVETLPGGPGVYRMLNREGDVLYVGKARNLKRRVVNYTSFGNLSNRIRRMVSETVRMEIVTTHTEVEALLLEANLIKKLEPRYNVLLRDDKSFPHILLTGDHPFPQITKHRGSRTQAGDYFGPFAAVGAVNSTIIALQRAFLLRNCSDAIFSARTRPCLQFQIKRCSAPCVDRISAEDYRALVDQAKGFLGGHSREIQDDLVAKMQAASEETDFEQAAKFRDRIRALTAIQAHQDIHLDGVGDADIIALHQAGGQTCIQVFFFRAGTNYGNRAYFPAHDKTMATDEIMAAFLGQFYADKQPSPLLLLSEEPAEADLLAEALAIRAGRKVVLHAPKRGDKRAVLDHALTNAREALGRRLAESSSQRRLLEGVQALFELAEVPERIEVYDNSHIQGTNALGGMIVAGLEGFTKTAYRKFNIKGEIAPGDDYAMMREVLTRRFGRQIKEDPERTGPGWPGLVMIDGGEQQLKVAIEVLEELDLSDLPVVSIAKGPDRDAGREKFFLPGKAPFQLEPKDPVLYFLQRLRDEAHRFAIGSHRARRQNAMARSELDEVPGIGAARRKALLLHFGSVKAIKRAGLNDLEKVPGISGSVAQKVYDYFHTE
jgi:excinuclease ABC subunit C